MKLIIDIPEVDYNYAKQQVADGITNPYKIWIANGTPIPDNATNGEVLDKLFPNLTYGTNGEHYHVWSNDGKCTMNIHQDWWNAPYQKGGK